MKIKESGLPEKKETIETMIGWVNLIPKNTVFPDSREVWHKYFFIHKVLDDPKEHLFLTFKDAFEECFSFLSENNRQILVSHFYNDFRKGEALEDEKSLLTKTYNFLINVWYVGLIREQRYLRDIARFFSHLRKKTYKYVDETTLVTLDGQEIDLPQFSVQLSQKKGKGAIYELKIKAFIDIDLNRIRSCEICDRIFWAKNIQSETCDQSCRNALRQRNHRKKNKEEINKKRRENYSHNKKQKEIKKKNGTL